MSGKITLTGMNTVNRFMRRMEIAGRGAAIARPALYRNAELMMTESKRNTPVDKGLLRASGEVRYPAPTSTRTFASLDYTEDYAVYVHEDLTVYHPVGHAKFLEKAVNKGMRRLERDIAKAYAAIGKGLR
jgi:hypothetical protein